MKGSDLISLKEFDYFITLYIIIDKSVKKNIVYRNKYDLSSKELSKILTDYFYENIYSILDSDRFTEEEKNKINKNLYGKKYKIYFKNTTKFSSNGYYIGDLCIKKKNSFDCCC